MREREREWVRERKKKEQNAKRPTKMRKIKWIRGLWRKKERKKV